MSGVTLSPSCRRKPRISYLAIHALAKKLDPVDKLDWRIVAPSLDLRKFTTDWIDGTIFECNRPGFSPTHQFLKEWQQRLSCQEDVPVQVLIDTLENLGRRDVASLIRDMIAKGIFLDPLPPEPQDDGRTAEMPHLCNGRDAHGQPHRPASPQESSFTRWQDSQLTPPETAAAAPLQLPGASGCPFCPAAQQAGGGGGNPLNFQRSNLSLNTTGSGKPEPNPNPNPLRHRDERGAFSSLTWPASKAKKRPAVNTGTPPACESEQCCWESVHQERVHSTIPPLKSFPEVTASSAGASPIPVLDPFFGGHSFRTGHVWLAISALKSFKRVVELGIALKMLGQEVLVDQKMDAASDEQRRAAALKLYQQATYIVIIFNEDYIEEVSGRVQSSFQTRYFHQLMDNDFSRRGTNARLVPIIDHKRVRAVPPLFCDTPQHTLAFVCRAIQRNGVRARPKQAGQGRQVSIERVVYASR